MILPFEYVKFGKDVFHKQFIQADKEKETIKRFASTTNNLHNSCTEFTESSEEWFISTADSIGFTYGIAHHESYP